MQHPRHRIAELVKGRYELRAVIGRGAMADVFRAFDYRSGQDVALKILRQSVASDAGAIERFRREAKAQEMVRHRNVAQLYGGGVTASDEPFLVVELLNGRSLRTVLKKEKRVDTQRALAYCIQALEGLAAIHSAGIQHRDLKPANLMLEPIATAESGDGSHDDTATVTTTTAAGSATGSASGSPGSAAGSVPGPENERVVLIDFGFASLEGAKRLTQQGHVVGSLTYMAPERLRSKPSDERAEVYSMGVILYELITGRPPFSAKNDYDLIHAHLQDSPSLPSRLAAACEISPATEALLMKCLAKDPEERPQSARDMAHELQGVVRTQ